jgi:hypothetical protein
VSSQARLSAGESPSAVTLGGTAASGAATLRGAGAHATAAAAARATTGSAMCLGFMDRYL